MESAHDGRKGRAQIKLPELDAIIGNPPYVRHEKILKQSDNNKRKKANQIPDDQTKEYIARIAENSYPGSNLTKQSDLHVYFWLASARFLKRLKRPLIEILGKENWKNISEQNGREHLRQKAAEDLRDLILKTKTDKADENLRILVKRQGDLWNEGLSVAEMFARQKELSKQFLEDEDEEETIEIDTPAVSQRNDLLDYGGDKWGRYLRAPKFYFDIMREFGAKFTRIGDIAQIKFGIKSGCDAFFMPRDVSAKLLEKHQTESEWRTIILEKRCKRAEVESGKVRIIEAGDKTLHPIESEFVRPEVHSLMSVKRPVIRTDETDRVVIWLDKPLVGIKGTYVHDYIAWGSRQTFNSNLTVPNRSTCQSRALWYDVTGLMPGVGFMPMAQKYRHIIAYNPDRIPCNHNLFDIHSLKMNEYEEKSLMAALNSTVVGFFKHFYGRYAGAEGTLKTEVVDSLMMEISFARRCFKGIEREIGSGFREN